MCTYTAAAAAKSRQSCPILCDPKDGSPPGSTVPGILQARTLDWVAIAFSSNPLLVNLKLGTGLPGCPDMGLVDHSSWTFLGNIYLYVGSSATCSHVVSSCLFRFDCTKSSLLCAGLL